VLALSTEPTSVPRTAYEAVWAGRVPVVSDWPHLRALFPCATPARNDAAGLAAAIRTALARHAELRVAAPEARRLQSARSRAQLQVLREWLRTD